MEEDRHAVPDFGFTNSLLITGWKPSVVVICIVTILCGGSMGIVQQSYVAITDPTYKDRAFTSFTSSTFLIQRKQLGKVSGPASYYECLKYCALLHNCHSFVKYNTYCYLLSRDNCKATSTMHLLRGGVSYDVRPAEDTELPVSCYKRCIRDVTSCIDCGKPNCNGTKCNECSRFCWELAPQTTELKSMILWPLGFSSGVLCDGIWQMISVPNKRSIIGLEEEPLWLKLVVVYSDNSKFTSYFDFVNVHDNNALSVGEYIGGKAGNFWGAPFENRAYTYLPDTNCRHFYYESPENCTATAIDTYDDQVENNVTNIVRGYEWMNCEGKNDSRVTGFKYYISNDMDQKTLTIENSELSSC